MAPRPRRGASGMPSGLWLGPVRRLLLRPVLVVRTADTTPPNLHTPLTRSIMIHSNILQNLSLTTHHIRDQYYIPNKYHCH